MFYLKAYYERSDIIRRVSEIILPAPMIDIVPYSTLVVVAGRA